MWRWNTEGTVAAPGSIVHHVLKAYGENYQDWSVQVKTYLLGKDLWDVVESTSEPSKRELGESKFKSWRKSDAKALHIIQACCGPDQFALIRDETTASKAWYKLAAMSKPNETPGDNSKEEEFLKYKSLFDAVKSDNWDLANMFLTLNPDAITAKITYLGKTALHTAADAGHLQIVKNLVHMMQEEDLEIRSEGDKTPLVVAINRGSFDMVQCMVKKNKKLVSILDASKRLPVVLAYRNSHWDLAKYLYSVTPLEDLMQEKGSNGATLISQCFYAKKYDIAWDLIQHYPKLTITKDIFGESPIYALASVPSSFPCGKRLIFWKQWIYDSIETKPSPTLLNDNAADQENGQGQRNASYSTIDITKNIQNLEDGQDKEKSIMSSVAGSLARFFRNLSKHLGIPQIYEMKRIHDRSSEFLNCMCKEIKHLNRKDMRDGLVEDAVLRAVERGIPEFVTRVCEANQELARSNNEIARSIFHYAIVCRQEKVYNLIYGHHMKNAISTLTDSSNNNMLHMAALLSPFSQLNQIPSAAMQMQRELQWFKEIENLVAPKAREFINWTDRMTPRELFTKNHRSLLKDGEKWMKETATSFTVVGALIVTLMFATAFTVPGGYHQDTGLPILINERLFMVFIISDAISLFSATTSSLMFLGILTSRYAEDDFLKLLPTKMIIGLFTLFFSIATMMIAFCAALLLILQEKPWTAIPIILLSCVPVTLFAVIKIPLLVEILVSTYGRGIFDKNDKKWL